MLGSVAHTAIGRRIAPRDTQVSTSVRPESEPQGWGRVLRPRDAQLDPCGVSSKQPLRCPIPKAEPNLQLILRHLDDGGGSDVQPRQPLVLIVHRICPGRAL